LAAWHRRRPRRSAGSPRPLLEGLEARLAPAVHLWGGVGDNNLWSNPGNWDFGGVPQPSETNVVLVFDSEFQTFNMNDIPNLTVAEIDFHNFGYTLIGDTITLKGDTTVLNDAGFETVLILGLNLTTSGFPLFLHDHVFNASAGSTLNLNGPIAGPSNDNILDFQGSGTLILSNTTDSYGGTTLINQGNFALGANNAVPAGTAVEVGLGATFDLAGFNDTIGSLSNGISGAGNVNLGGGQLTTGGNNAATTFSGVFNSVGNLAKEGTGTFTLTASNGLHATELSVNGGILRLGDNDSADFAFVAGTLDLAAEKACDST
jgi:autotransporter-associated beta strand protein